MDVAQLIAQTVGQDATDSVTFARPVGKDEKVIGVVPDHLHGYYALQLLLATRLERAAAASCDTATLEMMGEQHKVVASVFEISLRSHIPTLPKNPALWELRAGWKVVEVVSVIKPLPERLNRRIWPRR